MDGYESWVGDGYCDDGTFGMDFVSCTDFNCDNGDCGTEDLGDGTCGTPAGPCDGVPYPTWAGDGYCDSANNTADCYDGGDCCESTCVDGSYSCESYGGCNGDCLDPNGNDDACATCEELGGMEDCVGTCVAQASSFPFGSKQSPLQPPYDSHE
jgi:hypothetical protein